MRQESCKFTFNRDVEPHSTSYQKLHKTHNGKSLMKEFQNELIYISNITSSIDY